MAENLIYDFGSIFYAWFHLKRGKWKSAHAYIQKYHAIYIQKSQKLINVATKTPGHYDTKFLQKFEMSLKNELFEHLDYFRLLLTVICICTYNRK